MKIREKQIRRKKMQVRKSRKVANHFGVLLIFVACPKALAGVGHLKRSGKIAERIGTKLSALHSTFHFGRKSRRIASFLMLST